MSDRHVEILREVTSLPTAPFVEHAVAAYVRRFVEGRKNIRVREDRWGNLLVSYGKGRRAAGGALWLMAHMDHPGFVSGRMVGRRRLEARWFGGVDEKRFAGAKVRFYVLDEAGGTERSVRGVVKSTVLGPPALTARGVMRRVETAQIDVDGEVPEGMPGMWGFPDSRVNGTRLRARACDDLGQVAAMLCLLEDLDRSGRAGHVTCAFTRAEEVGFVGAIALAREKTVPPDAVVVSLECSSAAAAGCRLGDGPILRVGDLMTIFDRVSSLWIENVARDLAATGEFAWQKKLMPGGTCEATAVAAYGQTAAAMAVPLGNYHNQAAGDRLGAEYIDTRDFQGMVRWLNALIDRAGDRPAANAQLHTGMEKRFSMHRKLLKQWW